MSTPPGARKRTSSEEMRVLALGAEIARDEDRLLGDARRTRRNWMLLALLVTAAGSSKTSVLPHRAGTVTRRSNDHPRASIARGASAGGAITTPVSNTASHALSSTANMGVGFM
ncbi:MAG: hypothetical protein J0L91_09090, partial [Burkholderiales bacterium]|nr:hypothetical protein [Burkholderiales bacterium]